MTRNGGESEENRRFGSQDHSRRDVLKSAALGSLAVVGASATSGIASAQRAVSNDEIRVEVDDTTGQFQIFTADGDPLLHPGNTSGMTVQIDGTNYTTWCNLVEFVTDGPRVVDGGDGVTMTWALPGATLTRELRLAGEAIDIDLQIRIADDGAHSVNVRYLFDYQVGQRDGSPILVDGRVHTEETQYANPTFDRWKVLGQEQETGLTGVQVIDDEVSRFDIVEWETAAATEYEYEPATSTDTGDSAGLIYWKLGTLDPSTEKTVSMAYGTGAPTRVPSHIDRADRNDDGEISTAELRKSIQDWAAGEYTTDELNSIIRAWSRRS